MSDSADSQCSYVFNIFYHLKDQSTSSEHTYNMDTSIYIKRTSSCSCTNYTQLKRRYCLFMYDMTNKNKKQKSKTKKKIIKKNKANTHTN